MKYVHTICKNPFKNKGLIGISSQLVRARREFLFAQKKINKLKTLTGPAWPNQERREGVPFSLSCFLLEAAWAWLRHFCWWIPLRGVPSSALPFLTHLVYLSLSLVHSLSLSLSLLTRPLSSSYHLTTKVELLQQLNRVAHAGQSDFWGSWNVRTQGGEPRHCVFDGEGPRVVVRLHVAHCHWFGRRQPSSSA